MVHWRDLHILGWLAAAWSRVLSVPALRGYLARGVYVMGNGYSIFWDVTWGVLLYAAALAIYETQERTTERRRTAP